MSKWKSALLVAALGTASALFGCGGDNNKPIDAPQIDAPPDSPPKPPAQLSIIPLTADFGSTTVNVAATSKSFTITNTGGDVSGTISATIMGSGAANFAVETNTCTTLDASATCMVTVSFTPQTEGAKSANLVVAASPGGSVMSSLDGTGLAIGNINATPSSSGFPDTVVGATSATTATFTVSNTGGTTTGTLAVTGGGTNPGDFTATSDNCSGNTLPGAGTCTFTVAFTPASAGSKSASFIITASGGPGGTTNVAVTGNALAQAALRISPSLQDFGSVVSGQAGGNVTFVVSNVGGVNSGTLSQSVTTTDFAIVSGNCGAALAPAATCNVVVHFTPQSTGSKSASLNVMGTPGGTASATLLGTGISAGQISPNPGSLSFNSVTVGQTSGSQSVTITNNGGAATGALVTALGGNDPSQFIFVTGANGCQGAVLAPTASCTIALAFAPTSGAGKSATLSVTGAPGGTATVGLSGTGIPDAKLDLTPASHDFGTIGRGTQTSFFAFTLTNNGGVTSGLPNVSLNGANSGEFTMSNGCLAALAPAASCIIQVRFSPTANGNDSATLNVTGAPGGATSANVFGQAVDPAGLQALPSSRDFDSCSGGTSCTSGRGPAGETLIGESSTQSFVVTNTSMGAPTGTLSFSITGTNASEFSQTNNCPATLVAGANCTVVVTFTPTAQGFRTASISVSASPGGTAAVGLSGDALPRFEITAPATNPFDFGSVVDNTSAPPSVTVTLVNNEPGSASLTETLSGTDYSRIGGSCGVSVAGYSGCTVDVRFLPTSTGTKPATLTFAGNGGGANNTAVQSFTGKGVDSLILTANTTTDFGPWATGTASGALTFTVTNPANSPTSGPIATNLTNNAFQIIADNCAGATLTQTSTCTIQVKFLPTTTGSQGATLSVAATPGGATSINITGTGVLPASLGAAPNPLAFGPVFSGETSTQTITVTNPAGTATSGPVTFSISGGDAAYSIVTGGGAGTCGATGSTTLAANTPCTIKVQFAPTALTFGAHNTDTLTISASPGTGASGIAVPLTGTSVSTISISAPAVPFDFGIRGQGSTTNQDFTVRNDSNLGVTIPTASITGGAGMTITANNCNTGTIASHATCTITVQFAPGTNAGDYSRTLTAQSSNGTATGGLLGHANTSPAVAWTEAGPIDYGSTLAADTGGASHTFTLKNNGEATSGTITISTVGNAVDWSITANTCAATLGGGASCTVTVKFAPPSGASGDLPTTLTAAVTGQANTTASLTGRAVASGGLTLSPPVASFASTQVGATSAEIVFTLQNTSGSTQGYTVGLPANFVNTGNGTCVAPIGSLAMGASCTLTIAFQPGSNGLKTGDLAIASAGNPQSAIPGTGLNPAAISFNVTSHNFGSVATDASTTFDFVLTNNGDVNATGITHTAVVGANPLDFVVTTDTCTSASVIPGGTCKFTVKFAPTAVGARSANFSATGASISGGTQLLTLAGNGVLEAILGISPTLTQSAGSRAVGANDPTAGTTFTVTNGGDVTSGPLALSLSNSTDFFIAASSTCVAGNTLASSGTCTVVVKFSPKTLGNGLSTTLTVSASPGGSVGNTVTGNGTSAVTVTPSPQDFGTVANGTGASGTVTFTFHNNADVATGLLYTQLGGTNATDWTILTDNCAGKTLTDQGGATPSCTIDMVFTPRSGAGGKSATLTVSGTPGNSAPATMTGTAN